MNTIHPDNTAAFYYDGRPNPKFDARDAAMLAEREAMWNKIDGPRVGDFARMPDGSLHRFAHDWRDWGNVEGCIAGLQTTSENGSFYFDKGSVSYSGGLDPIVATDRIKPTNETKPGRFWFFHHDLHTAHNGVEFMVNCRVFDIRPAILQLDKLIGSAVD